MRKLFFVLLFCCLLAAPLSAKVISGSVSNWNEWTVLNVGDGSHSVGFIWGAASPDNMFFYGGFPSPGLYSTDSEVAFRRSITEFYQVTSAVAGSLPYVSGTTHGEFNDTRDAGYLPGVGSFLVARNRIDGYYAMLHVNAYRMGAGYGDTKLDVTWVFQTDGTGDFSSFTPEPTGLALTFGGMVALAAGLRLRRTRR